MNEGESHLLRLLVVDDEEDILNSFQQALCPDKGLQDMKHEMAALEAKLFAKPPRNSHTPSFKLTLCRQASHAIQEVKKALEEDHPFAVAFVDVRLTPGRDGVWTAQNIRSLDPHTEIVVVTGYSDVDPSEIGRHVPPEHKLLYVQKPLYPQEIRQFALALSAKWNTEKLVHEAKIDLEKKVRERTAELNKMCLQLRNELAERKKAEQALGESMHQMKIAYEQAINYAKAYKKEIDERKQAEEALQRRTEELKAKAESLEEVNTTLKVLLKQRKEDKTELERKVLANIKDLIFPYVEGLKTGRLDRKQDSYLNIIESNLNDIISPFSHELSKHSTLSPREMQVADLVRRGKTTKEIAELLHVSTRSVDSYRHRIRKKLGLKDKRANLMSHLLSVE